jgi:hypothetical protein
VNKQAIRARIDGGHTGVMPLEVEIGRRDRAVKILQRRP